jgi:hypothetical protein
MNEMDKKQQELTNATLQRVRQNNVDVLRRETDKTFEALVVEPTREKARIPEQIFKDSFLPYFSGQASTADNPDVLPMWVGIAGSPSSEVSIVDSFGNVIYDVPALMDLTVIDSSRRKLGESLSTIYSQYELHSNQLPVVGERYLADAMEKKTPTLFKPSEKFAENTQRWNDIFDRYGIKVETMADNTKSLPTSGDDIDVEYE